MNHHSLEVVNGDHVFSHEMREISGFGKGGGQRGREYEKACRRMVLAGIKWLDDHPTADPKFHGYKDVYGICMEDNDDEKALSEAIVAACSDCSGAMHQAAVSHVLMAKSLGWEKYVEEMSKPREGEEEPEMKLMPLDELRHRIGNLISYYDGLLSEKVEWVERNLELARKWLTLVEQDAGEEDFENLDKELDCEGVHRDAGWMQMKALVQFSREILNKGIKN